MEHAAKIADIATTDHSQCSSSPAQSSMRKTFSGLYSPIQSHGMFQTAADNTSESS